MNTPDIIHETTDYLVVKKPAGLLVHPDGRSNDPALTDVLGEKYPEIQQVGDDPTTRPGIVHRLDKNVSGVMVVARTQEFYEHIKHQFQARTVQKTYTALVHGPVSKDDGRIERALVRGGKGKMVARTASPEHDPDTNRRAEKDAITDYTVLQRFTHYTLLHALPRTGRMHQIRVHLHSIGHPIVGDPVYTSKRYAVHEKNMKKKYEILNQRIWLHATELSFQDLAGEKQTFTAPVPSDMMEITQTLS